MNEVRLCACGCKEQLTPDYRGRLYTYKRGHQRRARGPEFFVEDRGYLSPCWIWARTISSTGYGQARRPEGGQMTAHRMMYERFHGPLPRHLEPDHLCRVRACVNPDHLEPVTRSENNRRGLLGKLSLEAIREIRNTSGPHLDMALKHDITRQYVSSIRLWRCHKEVV